MLIGKINVKSFILELYMINDTKIYLRLNRNQNEQRWIVPRFTSNYHEKNVQQNLVLRRLEDGGTWRAAWV